MTYKGFTYTPDLELEEDNRKVFHEIKFKGRYVVPPKWFQNISPYRYPTTEEFMQAVDEIQFETWVENA
jgi:hypothetical protein